MWDLTGLSQLEPKAQAQAPVQEKGQYDFSGIDKLEPKGFLEKIGGSPLGVGVGGFVTGATLGAPYKAEGIRELAKEHPVAFDVGRTIGSIIPYVLGATALGPAEGTIASLLKTGALFGSIGGAQKAIEEAGTGKPMAQMLKDIAIEAGKQSLFAPVFELGKAVELGEGAYPITRKILSALGRSAVTGAGVAGMQKVLYPETTNKEAMGQGATIGLLSLLGEVPGLAQTVLGRLKKVQKALPEAKAEAEVKVKPSEVFGEKPKPTEEPKVVEEKVPEKPAEKPVVPEEVKKLEPEKKPKVKEQLPVKQAEKPRTSGKVKISKELEPLAKEAKKYKSAEEFYLKTGGGKYNLGFIDKLAKAKDNEVVGTVGDFIIGKRTRELLGNDVLKTKIIAHKRISDKVPVLGSAGALNKDTSFGKKGDRVIIINNKSSHIKADVINTINEEIAHTKRSLMGREMKKMDLEKFNLSDYEKLPQEISGKKFAKYIHKIQEDKAQLTDIWNQVHAEAKQPKPEVKPAEKPSQWQSKSYRELKPGDYVRTTWGGKTYEGTIEKINPQEWAKKTGGRFIAVSLKTPLGRTVGLPYTSRAKYEVRAEAPVEKSVEAKPVKAEAKGIKVQPKAKKPKVTPKLPQEKITVKGTELPLSTLKTELLDRGFTESQVERAKPETLRDLVEKGYKPEEISILPNGGYKVFSKEGLTERKGYGISEAERAYGGEGEYEKEKENLRQSLRNVRSAGRIYHERVSKIANLLSKRGFIDYRGTEVHTPQDVAEIAAIFRHPQIEHLQFIFVKDGKVVAHQVISSGDPSVVNFTTREIYKIVSVIRRLKADEVYVAHNHPSGDYYPSTGDLEVTKILGNKLSKIFPGRKIFKGHIVTDDKNFSFIHPTGDYEVYRFKSPKEKYPISAVTIRDVNDVVALSKEILENKKKVIVFFMNSKGGIISVDILRPTADIERYIREKKVAYRAPYYSIVSSDEKVFRALSKREMPTGGLDNVYLKDNGEYKAKNLFVELSVSLPYRVQEKFPKEEVAEMHGGPTVKLEPFIEEDVKPFIKGLRKLLRYFVRGTRRFWAPEGESKGAWEASKAYRKRSAESSLIEEKLNKDSQKRWLFWQRIPKDERVKILMAIERSEKFGGPLGKIVDIYRQIFNKAYEFSKTLDDKIGFVMDYIPHIYEDPPKVEKWLKLYLARKGRESFAKERVYKLLEEAQKHGFKLKTTNLEELAQIRMNSALRSRTIGLWLDDLKNMGLLADEKFPGSVAISTPKGVFYTTEDIARVIERKLEPSMYAKDTLGGELYKTWMGAKNTLVSYILSLSGYHGIFTSTVDATDRAIIALKEIARGHLLSGVKELAKTPLSPLFSTIRGARIQKGVFLENASPAVRETLQRLTQAGGRIRMPAEYRLRSKRAFLKAIHDKNVIGATLRLPRLILETMQKPILEYYVSKLKLADFEFTLNDWIKNHPKATDAQIIDYATKLWDSIDNRLGQLVYDNLFWQRWARDLGVASTLSLGWQTGIARETLGAAKDVFDILKAVRAKGKRDSVFTDRILFVLTYPVVVGALGWLINELAGHRHPKTIKDLYAPVIGKERVILPAYTKDFFSLREAIRKKGLIGGLATVAGHKLVPILADIVDLVKNRNYYDAEIVDPQAPAVEKLREAFKFLLDANAPISIQSYRRILQADPNAPVWRKALPFLGLSNAPKYMSRTVIQEKIFDLMSRHFRKVIPHSEWVKLVKKRKLRDKIRSGTLTKQDILDAYKEGLIKSETFNKFKANFEKFMKDAKLDSDVRAFKHLTSEEQEALIEQMTPQEKAKYLPYAHPKVINELWEKLKIKRR